MQKLFFIWKSRQILYWNRIESILRFVMRNISSSHFLEQLNSLCDHCMKISTTKAATLFSFRTVQAFSHHKYNCLRVTIAQQPLHFRIARNRGFNMAAFFLHFFLMMLQFLQTLFSLLFDFSPSFQCQSSVLVWRRGSSPATIVTNTHAQLFRDVSASQTIANSPAQHSKSLTLTHTHLLWIACLVFATHSAWSHPKHSSRSFVVLSLSNRFFYCSSIESCLFGLITHCAKIIRFDMIYKFIVIIFVFLSKKSKFFIEIFVFKTVYHWKRHEEYIWNNRKMGKVEKMFNFNV